MLGEVSQTEKDRMFFNMWNLILKSEWEECLGVGTS
jgi:hypothetical protein